MSYGRLNPAVLIAALCGICLVVLTLLVWRSKQSEAARRRLRAEFGAEIEPSPVGRGWTAVFTEFGQAELSEVAKLLARSGPVTVLDLSGSETLERLAGVELLAELTTVIAAECPKLVDAQALASLPRLEEAIFPGSPGLADAGLPENLPGLKSLDLSDGGIRSLSTAGLPALEYLFLSRCEKLTALDVSGSPGLRQIAVDGCRALPEIGGLGKTPQLTDLNVSSCHALKRLPGIGALDSLAMLDLRNVLDLENFGAIGELKGLNVLRLGGQSDFEDLTPFGGLEELGEMQIEGSAVLASLKGMPPNLREYAGFYHCTKLTTLAGIEAAKDLQHLDLTGCVALTDVSALARLTSLESVNLSGCRGVTDISMVRGLPGIGIVQLGGSGVSPASIADLIKAMPDTIFDFSTPEPE